MKKVLLVVCMFFLCAGSPYASSVMDFEDLGYTTQYGSLTEYNGFTFTGVNWINGSFYTHPNWTAGINGQYAIATRNFGDFTITRSTAFDLEGLSVTNTSASAGQGYISITGYFEGSAVAFYDLTPSGAGVQHDITLNSDWDEIDRFVVFVDVQPGILSKAVVDDIIYSETAVPVPGAILLLGSGLIGLIGIRRTKKEY